MITYGKNLYFAAGDNNFEYKNAIYKIHLKKLTEDTSKVMDEDISCFDKAEIVYKYDFEKENNTIDSYMILEVYCYDDNIYFQDLEAVGSNKANLSICKLKSNGEREIIYQIYNSIVYGMGSCSLEFKEDYFYGYTIPSFHQ